MQTDCFNADFLHPPIYRIADGGVLPFGAVSTGAFAFHVNLKMQGVTWILGTQAHRLISCRRWIETLRAVHSTGLEWCVW
jgi:hypothetical protein